MDVGEFINTYSDDLINIHEARAAAYTHPLRSDYAFADWLDASFCRMLAVFVVGGIETMLESWCARDRFSILKKYFAQKGSNCERVTSLYQAFSDAGIQVDRQVFDDYLALKYIRNTIVHSRWKKEEKEWLDARGFPTDTRKLTKEHLDRVEHVNQNMMLYIALTGLADPSAPRPQKLVKLDQTITRRRDETGILRLGDMVRIIWNNLERIDAHIYADIEKTVITKRYDWTEGRSRPELEALGNEEVKRLLYRAARRAGEEDYEPLAQHRELAKEAHEFWREYWRRAVAPHEATIGPALDVFRSPDFRPENPVWGVVANLQVDDDARRLVDHILPNAGSLTSEEIVRALRAGKTAYEIIRNIMPLTLFTVRLPIVDPRNTQAYLREAERAYSVLQLKEAWYDCVERGRRCTDGGSLGFYVRMSRELAERPQ